ISTLGRQLQRIPLHPRLARILLDGRGAPEVARVCAELGTGALSAMGLSRRSDREWSAKADALAQELRRIASRAIEGEVAAHISDEELRHAIFTGYADRLAKRRANARERFVL